MACSPHRSVPGLVTSVLPTRPLLLLLGLGIGVLGVGALLFFRDATPQHPVSPNEMWAPPIQVASSAAYRGPWRMNESDWRFVDDPTAALGVDGTVGVVWTDHVAQDLFFRSYGPDGRAQAERINVSRNPDTFSWLPRMVFPDGTSERIYVLWQEIIFSGGTHGGEILFARSSDGGRSFTEPINLSQSEEGDGKGRLTEQLWHNGSLDLAVGPAGLVYVAWTEYEGRLWLHRSTDGGRHFGEPVHITGGPTTPARGPALDVDSSGTVHLAWATGGDPTANIHYTHSQNGKLSFAPPRAVATSNGHSDAPKIAVSAAGTVHLAYGESPSGPLRQYAIRYTRSENGSSFSPPIVLSRRHSDQFESAHYPHLQLQPNGTVHVLWELFPMAQGRPRALGYTQSTDGGRTFKTPSVVQRTDSTAGFNGSQQGFLMEKLAVNPAGELAVVNSTFQRGKASHIWLYRGDPSSR